MDWRHQIRNRYDKQCSSRCWLRVLDITTTDNTKGQASPYGPKAAAAVHDSRYEVTWP